MNTKFDIYAIDVAIACLKNTVEGNGIKTKYPVPFIEGDSRIKRRNGDRFAPLPLFIYANVDTMNRLAVNTKWIFVQTEDRSGKICANPWLRLSEDPKGGSIYYVKDIVTEIRDLTTMFKFAIMNKVFDVDTTKVSTTNIKNDPSEPSKETDQTSDYIRRLTRITLSNTNLDERICLLKKGKFTDLIIREAIGKDISDDLLNNIKEIITSKDPVRVKKLLLLEILDEIHPEMINTENIIGMMNSL